MHSISVGFIVASAIISILFIALFGHIKEFLQDETAQPVNKPYSLGRSIMFYWTVIVVFSICYLGITLDQMPTLDNSTLLLMGIVVGTSGTARVIDYVQVGNGVKRHQDDGSQGFLIDIISDQNGLSVHRFQHVIFNIVYGAYFISYVVGDHTMPVFSDTVLGLLGISSGAYALLKIPENPQSAPQPASSQQQTYPQPVQQQPYMPQPADNTVPPVPAVPPVASVQMPPAIPATPTDPAQSITQTS